MIEKSFMPKPYFNQKNNITIDEVLRVNHAGETAAKIIYSQQLKNLANSDIADVLKEMHHQETQHLLFYENYLKKYNQQPSKLLPLWEVLSKMLGSATSISPKLAMICTKAIEEVIDSHYQQQYDEIKNSQDYDIELIDNIACHLADEIHHKEIAISYLNGKSYFLIEFCISLGCKIAISLTKKF